MLQNSTGDCIQRNIPGVRLFIGYAAGIAMDFAIKEKNSSEELFIAEYRGHLAGCIMLCQTDGHDVGQLRLFAVEKLPPPRDRQGADGHCDEHGKNRRI